MNDPSSVAYITMCVSDWGAAVLGSHGCTPVWCGSLEALSHHAAQTHPGAGPVSLCVSWRTQGQVTQTHVCSTLHELSSYREWHNRHLIQEELRSHKALALISDAVCSVVCVCSLPDKAVKEYGVYRPYLIFFAMLDAIVTTLYKVCRTPAHSCTRSMYRHNSPAKAAYPSCLLYHQYLSSVGVFESGK